MYTESAMSSYSRESGYCQRLGASATKSRRGTSAAMRIAIHGQRPARNGGAAAPDAGAGAGAPVIEWRIERLPPGARLSGAGAAAIHQRRDRLHGLEVIGKHFMVGNRDPELFLAERHGLEDRERVQQAARDQRILGLQVLHVTVVEHLVHQELADRGFGRRHVASVLRSGLRDSGGGISARRSTLPLLVRGSSRRNSMASGTM